MRADYRISRDVDRIRFSPIMLNPEPNFGRVYCPKCGEEIANRNYLGFGRVYARCLSCETCYYLSRDRQRSRKLEEFT